jgi:putative tryptophan/tyrosine transport system substrate-binding protein
MVMAGLDPASRLLDPVASNEPRLPVAPARVAGMKRRDFLSTFLGLAAFTVLSPLIGAAQQAKVPVVGVLVTGRPDPELAVRLFREGLRDLGYVEGRNVRIEVRSAEGKIERLPELAAELVRQKVDIIVAWMTPVVLAAKRATTEIPIVMLGAGDPVGMGIVASFARPGGNITGMAGLTAELAGKNIELVREILPSMSRIAALCNVPDPFSKPFLNQIELAGKALGIEIAPVMVTAGAELDAAFPAMAANRVDAVIVQPSLPQKHVAELAVAHRLPAVAPAVQFPKAGGLMGYAPKAADSYRQAAVFVDKILKGAKPADLPVEQATRFELVINLKTANALGLSIPPALLARADEVIE